MVIKVLRVVAYNVLFTFAGLILIALVGEGYLRLTTTFYVQPRPLHFVQGVGLLLKPNVEVPHLKVDQFPSHTNSLGFLDREPINPQRAAESCHIAMIGDSFVEAKHVPIADKFHVRLEELAARHLPHLDITTSAYGLNGTGQINQLPLYDEFARHLSPKLVVLVFFVTDFGDNSPILSALQWGIHSDRQPFATAERDANGTMKLRPPHPDWRMFRLPGLKYLSPRSYFLRGLDRNLSILFPDYWISQRIAHIEHLNQSFGLDYESLFGKRGQRIKPIARANHRFGKETLLPFFEKELAFTAFALDQFVAHTERDGASLVILATHTMGTLGHPIFDRMNAMAEARGIPVIDQYDYIRRQGADPERDPQWIRDFHWNEQGHQWAAEALLEYVKENPEVCAKPAARVPTVDGGGGD